MTNLELSKVPEQGCYSGISGGGFVDSRKDTAPLPILPGKAPCGLTTPEKPKEEFCGWVLSRPKVGAASLLPFLQFHPHSRCAGGWPHLPTHLWTDKAHGGWLGHLSRSSVSAQELVPRGES